MIGSYICSWADVRTSAFEETRDELLMAESKELLLEPAVPASRSEPSASAAAWNKSMKGSSTHQERSASRQIPISDPNLSLWSQTWHQVFKSLFWISKQDPKLATLSTSYHNNRRIPFPWKRIPKHGSQTSFSDLGPISVTPFPSQFILDWNFVSL